MSRPLDPIAAQLRAERKRRNLSLPMAAELVGLQAVVIGSYERGDRIPPLDRLRKWAEGFDHQLVVIPAVNGAPAADTAAGHVRIEYGVTAGDLLLPVESREAAVALAKRMPGSVVVCRSVRLAGWEPAR